MRKLFEMLTIFIFFHGVTIWAIDNNIDSIKQKLTNNDEKLWVFTRMEKTLGSKAKCNQGEVWIFKKNNILLKNICENKTLITTSHNWEIYKKGNIDTILKIDKKEYTLIFYEDPKHPLIQFMKIRYITSKQSEETIDLIFSYEEE